MPVPVLVLCGGQPKNPNGEGERSRGMGVGIRGHHQPLQPLQRLGRLWAWRGLGRRGHARWSAGRNGEDTDLGTAPIAQRTGYRRPWRFHRAPYWCHKASFPFNQGHGQPMDAASPLLTHGCCRQRGRGAKKARGTIMKLEKVHWRG